MKLAIIRCSLACAVALAIGTPVLAFSDPGVALETYHRDLRKFCPKKRLDWLPPGALIDDVDAFRKKLPRAKRRLMMRIVGWIHDGPGACNDPDGVGATCDNVYNIYGFYRVKSVSSFARQVCAGWKGCTGQSDCEPARGRY